MQQLRLCAALRSRAALARAPLPLRLAPSLRAPFATFSPRRYAERDPKSDDDDFVVRHFEQYGPSKTDVLEIKEGEQPALQKEVDQLRQELHDMRELVDPGNELDDLFADIDNPEGIEDDDAFRLDDESQEWGVNFKLPEALRRYINDFNKLTRKVSDDFDRGQLHLELQRALWLQYLRCKRTVPSFIEQVPEETWDVLWQSQHVPSIDTEGRLEHLKILLDDISKAGLELSPEQKLVKIEHLFASGARKNALDLWNREKRELQNDEDVSREFAELGVRLLVGAGRLEQAQNMALEAVRGTKEVRTESLAPLIAAWAGKADEASIKVAWALYLYMREQKGAAITLEDFDQVIMAFMGCERRNFALAVFKDMILTGKGSPFDSAELARKAQGLYGELRKSSDGLADLNEVSLTALAYMPRNFENRYFYGSWIKRLIGLGEMEAATQVLQLMYERGIRPDARHINGIMGAWLRGDDPKQKDFAIQVGLTMVRERLKFVAQRRAAYYGEPVELDLPDPGLLVPPYISKNLPPATIETFSILLHHYERLDMQTTVQQLPAILDRAEIAPNAYFMNHLIYAALRRGDVLGAWTTFNAKTTAIAPDLESFAALWDCAKALLSSRGMQPVRGFPAPRTLFARMLGWCAALRPGSARAVRAAFAQSLYDQIVRCLCISRDVEGALVALYALRDTFGFYPEESTVRIVTVQLARLGEEKRDVKLRRARLAESRQSQKRLEDVMRLLKSITERRVRELAAAGRPVESLGPAEAQEEGLYRMAILLRMILRTRDATLADDDALDHRLETVAFEMGAGALSMSPPLHSTAKP